VTDLRDGEPLAETPTTDGATCAMRIDGVPLVVPAGWMVAAALELDARGGARRSPGGWRRQAFCGMGVCGECRVNIDGRAHRLACMTPCAPGMEVVRDA
jgi:predicted molibdopterin-dependent oxidoreductase YjgC